MFGIVHVFWDEYFQISSAVRFLEGSFQSSTHFELGIFLTHRLSFVILNIEEEHISLSTF